MERGERRERDRIDLLFCPTGSAAAPHYNDGRAAEGNFGTATAAAAAAAAPQTEAAAESPGAAAAALGRGRGSAAHALPDVARDEPHAPNSGGAFDGAAAAASFAAPAAAAGGGGGPEQAQMRPPSPSSQVVQTATTAAAAGTAASSPIKCQIINDNSACFTGSLNSPEVVLIAPSNKGIRCVERCIYNRIQGELSESHYSFFADFDLTLPP